MNGADLLTGLRQTLADLTRLVLLRFTSIREWVERSVKRALVPIGVGVGGLVLAAIGLLFLVGAGAAGLATVLPVWLALLVVGSGTTGVGALLTRASIGASKSALEELAPAGETGGTSPSTPGSIELRIEAAKADLVHDLHMLKRTAWAKLRGFLIAAGASLAFVVVLRFAQRLRRRKA